MADLELTYKVTKLKLENSIFKRNIRTDLELTCKVTRFKLENSIF